MIDADTACLAYFGPRPVEDGAMSRRAFVAGFERGQAAERERCARVCEAMKTQSPDDPDDVERGFNGALRRTAAAIRAQLEKEG